MCFVVITCRTLWDEPEQADTEVYMLLMSDVAHQVKHPPTCTNPLSRIIDNTNTDTNTYSIDTWFLISLIRY